METNNVQQANEKVISANDTNKSKNIRENSEEKKSFKIMSMKNKLEIYFLQDIKILSEIFANLTTEFN